MASFFTRASAALDRRVVRLMERRMAAHVPRSLRGRPGAGAARGADAGLDRRGGIGMDDARARLMGLAAAYGEGTLGAPSAFFPASEVPAIAAAPAGDGPLGTQVIDLSWGSEYEPFLPAARELHAGVVENRTAHVRWWTSGPGRPTIVAIHGWGGGRYWIMERAFAVPYWPRHGYDVAAFVLPFHGPRAPGASGRMWPSPNPLRTNEGFGQAIFELRALACFLRDRGASAVGAMGMSLGGYTSALWASVA